MAVIEAVTGELVKRGYRATLEYPGYVEVLTDHLRIAFGVANEYWDGDVYGPDSDGVVHTGVRSDCTDVQVIADALVKAVESCK